MSHTKGKLVADALKITLNGAQKTYYCIGKAGTKDVVAIIGEVGDGQDELSIEDARRLVGCWNACRGIPTEEIEAGTAGFLYRYTTVVDERDEALAVLRDVEAELTSVLGIVKPATRSRIAAMLAKHKVTA